MKGTSTDIRMESIRDPATVIPYIYRSKEKNSRF